MARIFNGSNQFFLDGPKFDMPAGKVWSLSVWFQMASLTNTRAICGRYKSGACGWYIADAANDSVAWVYSHTDVNNYTFVKAGAAIDLDTWCHLLVVEKNEGTYGKQYAWFNGVAASSNPVSMIGATSTDATYTLGVGCLEGTTRQMYWNGKIAELAIWGSTDVSANLTDLRTGAAAGKSPNNIGVAPTYYWKLDEASGNAVATVGGVNLTDNGSVGGDGAGTHTGLTIDYGGAAGSTLANLERRAGRGTFRGQY